jgi:hypothetical protein
VILHIPGIRTEKATLIFPISKRIFPQVHCSDLPSPALLLLSPTSAKDLKRISAKALDHGRIATKRQGQNNKIDTNKNYGSSDM